MTDTQCSYAPQNKEKFEEPNGITNDEASEACVKDKQLDTITANRNSDVGILKEQNFFIESTGCNSLSKLYSNRNCTNSFSGINDLRKPWSENAFINEEILTNSGTDYKENSDKNISNISLTSNKTKENEINGVSSTEDSICSMSDSEIVYYAVHIPVEFSVSDVLGERKENLHVYVDKEEVLKLVKVNKKARFKQFKTRKEAEEFALHGSEIVAQDGQSAISDSEKVMPFKRPKTEDMIQFRKDIEKGNLEAVREKIFENPKYLVSNGDTPSILQEGSRYNALHVAAKSKNAKITRLILDSITRLDFIGYLYDENDIDSCIARSQILLDRYLNTPDKGANETPLHLAVKHGAVEVVKVLLSYSQCQKNNVFNRYNKLPKDIICSRVCGPCEETKAAIASMLEEEYFVPVLRSEDNSLQPEVGEAFSMTKPLKLKSDLLSPRLEIRAYAGPMSKEKADLFKKKWKNPTRRVKGADSPLALRLKDTEKGLEKTGRDLAIELDVPWQEYWSFLDTFIDIASENGLNLLESYLKSRFQESFRNMSDGKCSNSSNKNSNDHAYLINDLCEAFEMCGSHEKQSSMQTNDLLCHTPKSKKNFPIIQRDHLGRRQNELSRNYAKNPIVYVERSCEVFGKRIGAAINSCVLFENHSESLKECLETQIKHLQTLIKSYKEDIRFQSIDFQLIHSRVAAVAIQSLQNMTDKSRQLILTALKGIDWSNGALSDDEDLNYNYKNQDAVGATTKQLHCLVKHLILQMNDYRESENFNTSVWNEADCQVLWAEATPCKCIWNKNTLKRNRGGLKRKQFRSDCDCDCDASPRKIQVDNEKEEYLEALANVSDENDDHFSTPPSGNSDSEEDVMEDVTETPNTFIFLGSLPTKVDYAVLEAIEKVPLSCEKYPNIYLWKHILQNLPKNMPTVHHSTYNETPQRKVLNFDISKSSPCKLFEKSLGGNDSPSTQETVMEPWERVTGPYSPRRSSRTSLSMLYYDESSIS